MNPILVAQALRALPLTKSNELKDFIAFAEYMMLRSSTDMNLRSFSEAFLSADLQRDSVAAKYFLDLYPNLQDQGFLPKKE